MNKGEIERGGKSGERGGRGREGEEKRGRGKERDDGGGEIMGGESALRKK
jgi:hypothetical protein